MTLVLKSVNYLGLWVSIIVGVLIFSGFIYLIISHLFPQRKSELVSDRIKSWWIIIIIFSLTAASGQVAMYLLFAFIGTLCLKELSKIANLKFITQIMLIATQSIYYLALLTIDHSHLLMAASTIILMAISVYLHEKSHKIIILSAAVISTVALSCAVEMINLSPKNISTLFYLIFLTEINDVMQFIWGKSFGSRKIAPRISPNKTVEGFVGGAFSTIVISIALNPFLMMQSYTFAALSGLVIACSGFTGDLFFSYLKRSYNVKNSGNLLPGHGGIIDRIDSLSFTAPMYCLFCIIY